MWAAMRIRLTCLIVGAMLLLPAAAFGQSAGDEQYEDPFAPAPEQSGGGGSGGEEPTGGGAEPAPAPAQESAPEPAQPAPATAAQETPQQLPYTGADEGLVALAGVVLLAGGVALRLKT